MLGKKLVAWLICAALWLPLAAPGHASQDFASSTGNANDAGQAGYASIAAPVPAEASYEASALEYLGLLPWKAAESPGQPLAPDSGTRLVAAIMGMVGLRQCESVPQEPTVAQNCSLLGNYYYDRASSLAMSAMPAMAGVHDILESPAVAVDSVAPVGALSGNGAGGGNSGQHYAAQLLAALGYGQQHFRQNEALQFMARLGLITRREQERLQQRMLRRDAAVLAYRTLQAPLRGRQFTLAMALAEAGELPWQQVRLLGLLGSGPKVWLQAGNSEEAVYRSAFNELGIKLPAAWLRDGHKLALQSYALHDTAQAQEYAKATDALLAGAFDFTAFGSSQTLDVGERCAYTEKHPVALCAVGVEVPGRSADEQRQHYEDEVGYVAVVYDPDGQPLYYKYGHLGSLGYRLSGRPQIVALMYHHFSEQPQELNSVTVHPDNFREQLRALKEAGYVSIRQQDLLQYLKGGADALLPEKSVVITIDDGYESNYVLAYPILLEEKMYASIYVVASGISQPAPYAPMMAWEQAREMYYSGYVDIQSHTYNSHYYADIGNGKEGAATVSRLMINGVLETAEQYGSRIAADIQTAAQLIEAEIGNRMISLTFPYGRHSKRLIEAARDNGHQLMYTVLPGKITQSSNITQLPRINVDGKYSAAGLLAVLRQYGR